MKHLAKLITQFEGKKKQVDIAQISEILRVIAELQAKAWERKKLRGPLLELFQYCVQVYLERLKKKLRGT